MHLPHSSNQSSLPIDEAISEVLRNTPQEIELASSLAFHEDDETYDGKTIFEISEAYSEFLRQTAAAISEDMGEPLYSGRLPDAMMWAGILGIEPSFDEIFVWGDGDKSVYLQLIWEDKDCPIVVSLGATWPSASSDSVPLSEDAVENAEIGKQQFSEFLNAVRGKRGALYAWIEGKHEDVSRATILGALQQEKEELLESVMRCLKSNEDTQQLRKIIASIEALRSGV